MPNTKNKVILSQQDFFYIDKGMGDSSGKYSGNYKTWLDLYYFNLGLITSNYNNKQNVLGAVLSLWA